MKTKKSLDLKPKRFARAKKSLGQNFLKSADALRKIISAGEIKKEDMILEIGPGRGALTEKILEAGAKVIAVEKDQELFAYLGEKFEEEIKSEKLLLIQSDILDFDPKAYRLGPRAYKIIANIPYNITGAILRKFLTDKTEPERMVLMVQKEVAKRIVAVDGKESLLSISVKAYGTPKIITKVPARYFTPAPKVDSAVILIKDIKKDIFSLGDVEENRFWGLLRAGFAHKRKILMKNLKDFDKKPNWENIFLEIGLKKDIRAEDLTLSNWIRLSKGH